MRVYVTHNPIELDEQPAGTAGSIAEQLRAGADPGRTFTLKADGVELDPGAHVPADTKVIEVVEWVGAELPVVTPTERAAADALAPPPAEPPTDDE